MRVVAIVQARASSTRLPLKVLELVEGHMVLEHVVDRVGKATLDGVVVATTINMKDDAIVRLCREQGWSYYRGSEADVLDRYYKAAIWYNADIVVRITGDCPLIDSGVIDDVVERCLLLYPKVDYVSNVAPRTYPRGLDVEAMPFPALKRLWLEVCDNVEREHVTLHMRLNPERFVSSNVENEKDYSHMRWVLDTQEDLVFIRRVYSHFKSRTFGMGDVLSLLEEHPDWVIKDGERTLNGVCL